MLETMPDVLTWGDDSGVDAAVHESYVELLGERMGQFLGHLDSIEPDAASRLLRELGELPDESFFRLLTAPEVSWRLLWPRQHRPEESAKFLFGAVTAEVLRLGRDVPIEETVWTALGDLCFSVNGKVFEAPSLRDFPPLDFDSPYGVSIDLAGQLQYVAEARAPLTGDDRQLVLDRLAAARDGIRETDPRVLEFVVLFTKALVLQRDPDLPDNFTSGSSGQFVGRSALGNPQIPGADDVLIAEGVVHEAIHSLLYMQEQRSAWVATDELYGPDARTCSLWTGTPLPLRSYLQACFVWYGLLHFWAAALKAETFDPRRVRSRIEQATIGFLRAPVLDQVAPYREGIAEVLLDTVDELQERVVATFGAGAAAGG
jgi:hypothetical protein